MRASKSFMWFGGGRAGLSGMVLSPVVVIGLWKPVDSPVEKSQTAFCAELRLLEF